MLPLEGVGDFVDITLVQNPWQALVVVVVVFALLIWPTMSARQSVKRIEHTLTSNNGGSTVKDANDRIEKKLSDLGSKLDNHIEWSEGHVQETLDRLAALEEGQEPKPLFKRLAA